MIFSKPISFCVLPDHLQIVVEMPRMLIVRQSNGWSHVLYLVVRGFYYKDSESAAPTKKLWDDAARLLFELRCGASAVILLADANAQLSAMHDVDIQHAQFFFEISYK